MWIPFVLLFLASPALLEASSRPAKRFYDTYNYYVIHHNPSHGHSPTECASALGAELVEQAGALRDHWLVRSAKQPDGLFGRPAAVAPSEDTVVASWHSLRRRSEPVSRSIRSLLPQIPRQRVKRSIPHPPNYDDVVSTLDIRDPIFSSQWHIINQEYPEHQMNVTGLWEEGITGKGVISALVDDGLDYESEDLAQNFYAPGSYDFNDHEPLPKPKLWDDKHGTRCAGEIAAMKNDVCGVGLAYESRVAGLRILSGPISDVDEAAALNYGYQESAIYSCSWGPPDNGRAMEGPNILIQRAVLEGINNGRGGKGSVFVFASGNGAASGDACNFDGYTNSIYSVTVGSIDHKGLHPYYSEACAANMVVTYSSGSGKHISTTDVGPKACSSNHGGTSAAAPLAVGVFALALEVRPDLTWRDIQHLCVNAAVQVNPEDPDWETTAVGRPFSYKYGYGKLDAYRYVTMARTWNLVKPQTWFSIPTIEFADATMVDGQMMGGERIVPGGIKSSTIITKEMLTENNFDILEHITVKVWITHTRRGDVEVELISPTGVKSVLASRRKGDDHDTGFVGWTFMTLKHWDENPVGQWTIRVFDQGNAEENGNFLGWTMTFWGSAKDSSQATKYELPDDPNEGHNLPPHPSATEDAEQTKQHPKPTANLPEDHAAAAGEATRPAFSTEEKEGSATPTSSPTSLPDAGDQGVFSHMYDLMSNQLWLVGAFGIVVMFGVGTAGFLWLRKRKAARRAKSAYAPLGATDDMAMRQIDRDGAVAGTGGERSAGGTRELYDAFGVGSDDEDDDENERSALTGTGRYNQPTGLTYHNGFLDDEGMSTGRSAPEPYRDDPDTHGEHSTDKATPARDGSEGSGDGSWQDASEAPHTRPVD